jgi:hypothetical protein
MANRREYLGESLMYVEYKLTMIDNIEKNALIP